MQARRIPIEYLLFVLVGGPIILSLAGLVLTDSSLSGLSYCWILIAIAICASAFVANYQFTSQSTKKIEKRKKLIEELLDAVSADNSLELQYIDRSGVKISLHSQHGSYFVAKDGSSVETDRNLIIESMLESSELLRMANKAVPL